MTRMRIVATGMVSGLAYSAEGNAALMRLEYDAFQETSFHVPETGEPIIGACIERINVRGASRLVEMADAAMNDLFSSLSDSIENIDVIFCLPDCAHPDLNEQLVYEFDQGIVRTFRVVGATQNHYSLGTCFYYNEGRIGYLDALAFARQRLAEKTSQHIMVVGVDSLVNNANISQLLGISNSDYPGRLVIEDAPDGMIVGEAAAAVLFTSSIETQTYLCCTGIGLGQEPAPLFSNDVSRADGLVNAVKQATAQANIDVSDTDFRIAAITGESYFFAEDSTMLYRCFQRPKESYSLWHTTDKIGEVGAATGPAMTVMAFWGTKREYAPGNNILCHISSETERRGAFILQYYTS